MTHFVCWMKHFVFMMRNDVGGGGRSGLVPHSRASFLKLSPLPTVENAPQFDNFFPHATGKKNPLGPGTHYTLLTFQMRQGPRF